MTARIEFAYAQTRMQARHGASPGSPQWQALEASHTAGHYLSLCRAGALADWVEGLDDSGDVHHIEQHLRERWQHHVDEVALWTPPAWRAAVRCFALLPDLMRLDTRQRTAGDPAASAARAPASSRTREAADDAATRWSALWRRQLPPEARGVALLRRPAEWLLPRLAGAATGRDLASGPAREALRRLFRWHAGSAVAVFAYLALVALDLERLRGGLVVRALFDGRREPLAA